MVYVRKISIYCKKGRNWGPYHAALTDYCVAIKKIKEKSWRQFTNEVNSLSIAAQLQRTPVSGLIGLFGSIRSSEGRCTSNAGESFKVLLKTHFPDSVSNNSGYSMSDNIMVTMTLYRDRIGQVGHQLDACYAFRC